MTRNEALEEGDLGMLSSKFKRQSDSSLKAALS